MSRHPRIPQANPMCVSSPIRSSLRSLRKGPGLLSPPSASPVPTPTVSRTLLGNFEVVSLVSLGFCDSGALGEVGWWSMAWMDNEKSWRLSHSVFPPQESLLRGRFAPSGHIEGFTAEIGASGSYCPQHVTLPVTVTFFDVSEQNAPAPFLV